MWALLSRKNQVFVVAGMTIVIVLAYQGASELWYDVRPHPLKALSLVVFVIATGLSFVANRCWRWVWRKLPILNRLCFPDLNGTWEGRIRSAWIDQATGQPIPPIPTTVKITQDLFDFEIKQTTDESISHSHRVIAEADPRRDRYRLWYDYDNNPKAEFHRRSTQHQGFAWLEINLSESRDELFGAYYTNRQTTGDLILKRTSR